MASATRIRHATDYLRASLLPKREQAAAVCYRTGKRGMEFLLVRTRSGRWTFPKGSIEPGMTYAESAALEAFEEAGVHGRIERTAFARYTRRGSSKPVQATVIRAFLCEVIRLSKPQERKRDRTWFSAEKAKHCLQERRTPQSGAELVAVVDRAVDRVRRLHSGREGEKEVARPRTDALLQVSLEAPYAALSRENRRTLSPDSFPRRVRKSTTIDIAVGEQLRKVLPGAAQQLKRNLLLGTGNKPSANVTSKVGPGESGQS